MPSIGIIGPVRRRAGTGRFACLFRRTGCSVVRWDRGEAARLLDPGARRPAVDAVAICSAAETHFDYLAAAVEKGLHVFCEKPVVWPRGHSPAEFARLVTIVAAVLDAAAKDGLVVQENGDWVYTLNEVRREFGELAPEGVRSFRCELSASAGNPPGMIMECAGQANSLLLELGCSGIQEARLHFAYPCQTSPAALDCCFRSRNAAGDPVDVRYHFRQQDGEPRLAAYEVNGERVERRIDGKGCRIRLKSRAGDREIQDPVRSSVEDFVARILARKPAGTRRILRSTRMSRSLLDACDTALEVSHA